MEEVKKVTVEDLDALVLRLKCARENVDEKKAALTEANKAVQELEAQAVEYLKELGRDKYITPEGTIYIHTQWTVKVPQSDEDKSKLFAWLREQNLFERYATVNSQSLNSLYRTLHEEAVEKGDMAFAIPGIGAPSLYEDLRLRKGK
jgi:hypothetical protein